MFLSQDGIIRIAYTCKIQIIKHSVGIARIVEQPVL